VPGVCIWVRSRHHGDPDRRARRAVANSNERRRMQSINAGFQSLHELVKPRHGEKLSKVRIILSLSLSVYWPEKAISISIVYHVYRDYTSVGRESLSLYSANHCS